MVKKLNTVPGPALSESITTIDTQINDKKIRQLPNDARGIPKQPKGPRRESHGAPTHCKRYPKIMLLGTPTSGKKSDRPRSNKTGPSLPNGLLGPQTLPRETQNKLSCPKRYQNRSRKNTPGTPMNPQWSPNSLCIHSRRSAALALRLGELQGEGVPHPRPALGNIENMCC